MRIVRIREQLERNTRVRLHHITDIHAGAPDFAEKELKERIELIRTDDYGRWTYGGDGGDLIRHNDRRYTPTELHPRYRQATDIRLATLEHLRELLAPIADKCWGFSDWNHERAMDERFGGHFGVELACNLGIEDKFVDYRGFIHIIATTGKGSGLGTLIDLQHGWQAGRRQGGFVNQCELEMAATDASIILRGHSHRPGAYQKQTLGTNQQANKIITRTRTAINGGSWRRGYRDNLAPINGDKLSEVERSMWSETKGFHVVDVGGPVLILTFDSGAHEKIRREETKRPAMVHHTLVEGVIDARSLGLE